jgi:peptidoglycan/LPS O-acetylase OafA/YrhL
MNHAEQELASHTPRKDIQGLRALAVLLVVVFHAGWGVRGGFIGVDVFFVISGFVITGMLMRKLESRGSFSLRDFYSRRVRRLLPALALVVAVTFVLTAALGAPFNGQQGITALTGGGAVVGLANVVLILKSGNYFETPPASNPLLNTWSLSVEEQFYLVFPFVLLGLWFIGKRIGGGRRRTALVITGIAALTAASFVLSLAMSMGHWGWRFSSPESVAFYSSPTRAWEFGVGVLIAFVAKRLSLPRRFATPLFILGLVAVIAAAFIIRESDTFPGAIALWPVIATAIVLLAGASAGGPILRVTESRAAVALGDLSYSWYLWHWPLIAFSLMIWPTNSWIPTAAAVIALGLAWLTFRYVENPLRFNVALTGKRLLAAASAVILVVLAMAAVLYVGAQRSWWNSSLASMNEQVSAEHLWITQGCNSEIPLGSRPAECTMNADSAGSMLYLLGDSQAGMLSEAMLGVASRTNRPLSFGTKGACPFIDGYLRDGGRIDESCNSFVGSSVSWLGTQQPGTAVISIWAAYTWLDGIGLSTDGQSFATSDQGRLDVMRIGLSSVVRDLRSAGHSVVLVAPIPGFPAANPEGRFWYPYQCRTVTTLLDPASCGQSRSESEVKSELAPFTSMLEAVASDTASRVLYLDAELCQEQTCSTNTGNSWAYMDGQHISVEMSKSLGAGPLTVG